MNRLELSRVLTLGLFDKRIEGDDSLMELARQRFQEAGMGAEMSASTTEQLESLLKFRPSLESPLYVHLARELHVADELGRRRVVEFATRFAGQIHGLVLHDHPAVATRAQDFISAVWQLDDALEKIDGAPMLFVEYAVGLDPADFLGFFNAISDLERISPCIDIGHVGIRAAQLAFARDHRGEDVCALKSQPARFPQIMPAVDAAVSAGAAAVLDLIERVARLKKPVHFHLHDGHPLSFASPFGVADHLSFFAEVPLKFECRGRRAVSPMFGPAGLSSLVSWAVEILAAYGVSFTLEIHPTFERLPLGDYAGLFGHWTDKTNAEKMNHWLSILCQNHQLLRDAVQAGLFPHTGQAAESDP